MAQPADQPTLAGTPFYCNYLSGRANLSEKDMHRNTLIEAVVLGAAFLLNIVPAGAQQGGYPLYPWCASRGRATNCYFSTWGQCRAAASGGGGGFCYRNPWYEAYGPYYSFGRRYGRY